MTLADIMVATQLDLFGECSEGRELIEGTDHLQPWLGRMLARPSFVTTGAPEILRKAA